MDVAHSSDEVTAASWPPKKTSRKERSVRTCVRKRCVLFGESPPCLDHTRTRLTHRKIPPLFRPSSRALVLIPDGTRQDFFAMSPKLTMTRLNPGTVRMHGDIGIQAGDYTFTWVGADGPVEVDARFTFSFRREGNGWKIVEHHSSGMPTAPAALKAVSAVRVWRVVHDE